VVWTADKKGNITFMSRKWFEYVEENSTLSIFESWKKIIKPAMWEDRLKLWSKAISEEREYLDEFLAKGLHHDDYRWHIARTSVVRNEQNEIMYWVGSLIDVHEAKIFSEELERLIDERTETLKNTNLQLVHSNASLEQFAYIASHDLQEPLRKVKTFTTIFQQNYFEFIPEEGKEFIRKIHISSERMSALIRDVLNYSRTAQDQSGVVKTDLNGVLRNVLLDFELLADELSAEFKFDPLPIIQAVPLQMNQLFYNLVGNALKFADKQRPPVIEIKSYPLESPERDSFENLNPDKNYFKITVKDNGIGFEQDFAEQIFMIFQRLHSKSDFEGTGIGLALCQKIVHAHHGLIWADGQPGEGAVFNMILPTKQ